MHRDDEMLPHLLADVLPRDEVWLAEADGVARGALVLERSAPAPGPPRRGRDLIGQLSVDPAAQGVGIGSALILLAKAARPDGLDLWVYASNLRARAFYRARGFVTVGGTSAGNEERVPDLLLRWRPTPQR